jgi:hypothetical protein
MDLFKILCQSLTKYNIMLIANCNSQKIISIYYPTVDLMFTSDLILIM